jgi:dolichol-phosphate mannosyltransferase
MLLSILIPAYNEQDLVIQLLNRLLALPLPDGMEREVIIVDDGSQDDTAGCIEAFILSNASARMRLVRHAENRGKGAAIRTALEYAHGDVFIVQDADLEYDPHDIQYVVEPIFSGKSQVVYGSRIIREKQLGRSGFMGLITGKHPHSYVLAYLGGVMITRWVNFLSGALLTDEPTCYKCFSKQSIEGLQITRDDFAWEPELTMKLLKKGHRILEVPIDYHPRKRHQGKKINWKDGVKALLVTWKFR